MDKIKTVKIKNEDGTVSKEAFHISADARNIDMTNGYNVQETIGTIDVNNDGSIAEQLNNIEIKSHEKPYYFNTVADMKNANLLIGDYVCTLGYYSVNDGGAGDYQIVNGTYTDDGGSYHKLNNGLFAKLIIKNNEINIKQFGAKPNLQNFNNVSSIQNALNTKKIVYIGNDENEIYYVDSVLEVFNDVYFNAWIRMIDTDGTSNKKILLIKNYRQDKILKIINPLLDGNRDISVVYPVTGYGESSHCISIQGSKNIYIDGGKIINARGDGIAIGKSDLYNYSENININNVFIEYCYRNTVSLISSKNVQFNNCTCLNQNGYCCFLVEPNNNDLYINENLIIDGGYYYTNHSACIYFYSYRTIKNPIIKNCIIESSEQGGLPIRFARPTNGTYYVDSVLIKDVVIINNKASNDLLITTANDCFLQNVTINNIASIGSGQITSINKNVIIDNLQTLNSNTNAAFAFFAYNGEVVLKNSIFESGNPTSNFSGAVNIRGKYIDVQNNKFLNASNCICIGDISSSQTPTHERIVDNCFIENNIFVGSTSYSTSRGLILQNTTDITNLIYNYNYFNNILYKMVLQGEVTNATGSDTL